jgi:hypothetical protein
MENVVFCQEKYPEGHWSLQTFELSNPIVFALATFKTHQYVAHFNPTDSRGYRCIVRFIDKKDMQSTFNRTYSFDEKLGISLFTNLISQSFSTFVPIVQTMELGNNSHGFDDGKVLIGTKDHPCFLHDHIICRGNPSEEYFEGVKLNGPVSGELFGLRGEGKSIKGNETKIKWKEDEMKSVLKAISKEIGKLKSNFEIYGLKVEISE